MEIGKIISKLRGEKGLNQRELASHLGVSNGAIGMWETGKRQPDLETIKKMAIFFNVSTDYLLGVDSRGNLDYSNYQMDKSEFSLEFKCRLKEFLKEREISDDDFSQLTGFHPEEVDEYLWGNKIPSIENLIKIAGSLHISTDYLLGISDDYQISYEDKYFLGGLSDCEKNIIDVYRQLNKDNQDIIVGDMKKYLKEQRYEETVAADSSMRQAK